MTDFTKNPRPFYPRLSSASREIRLLHLQPGQGTEEADELQTECRLSVVSLDSNPSYEALSYRWGSRTSTVLVDGHEVVVPENLDEALRRFRLDGRERVLWADAVCIDQSQVAERNAQVALMADIYKTCERCLVWMGNTHLFDRSDGDSSGLGVGSLHELLAALSKKHHLDQPDAPPIATMFGVTRIPLMYLNMAPWWQRIWVVQEVVLAPQSLVLCGCMDHIKITFLWADLLELRDLLYHLLEVARLPGRSGAVPSTPATGQTCTDFLDVLLSVRHRECADHRDKIFGILSLVQDWGSWAPVTADYSKDARQVFTEVAVQMLQHEHGPRTLLFARGANPTAWAPHNLPTWVPDWT
ncbi:HET-domain-containing protein, partial [Trichocladium antarcticum]